MQRTKDQVESTILEAVAPASRLPTKNTPPPGDGWCSATSLRTYLQQHTGLSRREWLSYRANIWRALHSLMDSGKLEGVMVEHHRGSQVKWIRRLE